MPEDRRTMAKKERKTRETWNLQPLQAGLLEALEFARIVGRNWLAKDHTWPEKDDAWSSRNMFGVYRRFTRGPTQPNGSPGERKWAESRDDVARRILDRYLKLMELAAVPGTKFDIPKSVHWVPAPGEEADYAYGNTKGQMNATDLIEQIGMGLFEVKFTDRFGNGSEIFPGVTFTDDELKEVEALNESLERVRACALHTWCSSGPISDTEERVIRRWRALNKPLRYREVTSLLYDGASYSTQESRTGKFLKRFAEKVVGAKGDGSHEPYRLRQGAAERTLTGDTDEGEYTGATVESLDAQIAALEAQLTQLRVARDGKVGVKVRTGKKHRDFNAVMADLSPS
jgi:hypothetical protein